MEKLRFKTFLLLISLCALHVCAVHGEYLRGEEVINLQHIGHHGNHYNVPVYADEPEVRYNTAAQQVIVEGLGVVSYYDVEIVSQSSLLAVLTCVVDGTYDTIDISSLPDDDYFISIHTPLGNTYEGTFSNY